MKSNTSKKTRNVGGKNMGKFGKDTSIPRKKHKATKSMVEDEEKKETPTKSTQAAAAKIPSKDIRTSPTDNDASQHPPYVGKRFAKRFDDGQIYYGDIKEMYPPDTTETRETLWYIQFDDDDSAIMDFADLHEGLALYESHPEETVGKEDNRRRFSDDDSRVHYGVIKRELTTDNGTTEWLVDYIVRDVVLSLNEVRSGISLYERNKRKEKHGTAKKVTPS